MNTFELSRNFWNWAFENPEKINTNHSAIYFFAIEHCNRLGGKEKFGLPSMMTMEAVGIKKHQTYSKYFNQLIEFGFIKLIQKSTNQYSANIISLVYAMPKKDKALDKALVKHRAKQIESTGQSKDNIDKQETSKQEIINISYVDFLKTDYPIKFESMYKSLVNINQIEFLDFFNNKCILEDVPFEFNKIQARFNLLKSNWNKDKPKEVEAITGELTYEQLNERVKMLDKKAVNGN